MYNNFNLRKTWENYDSADVIKDKVSKIISIIPDDVKTIIDVGCGNGIITNELAKHWELTGLDSSEEALKYVKTPKVLASANQIPFDNHNFDLVLCSEMLEHLSDEDLVEVSKELMRIGTRYLLLTVPNAEFLEVSLVKCPDCHTIFHAWQHVQSFTKERLEGLFSSEFKLLSKDEFGPLKANWIPYLLRLKQMNGQWLSPGDKSICPHCGKTDFEPYPSNIITKGCNGLNYLLAGKKPYWLMILMERI
jgi:ubiquinone/menaquinone biosynthesis C-methylase UbiE